MLTEFFQDLNSTQLLTRMSKINVVVSKTFMGLFFLALAALIGYFEFYR